MGVVGALLVARWSWGLLRDSGRVLLDRQVDDTELQRVRSAVEAEGPHQVVDLHVWVIGPGRKAAILAIESPEPRTLDEYRALLPSDVGLAHVTIEISAPAAS
jgi:Co/Zn/Cd efflux system component